MEPSSPDGARPPSSSPEQRQRAHGSALGALLSVVSALVAVTCAARGVIAEPPASVQGLPAAGGPGALAPAAPVAPPAAPSAALPGTPPEIATDPRAAPELPRFRAALDALAGRSRGEPVRVLWLGDSHTSADYWTGAVRSALWARFPPGGPGFLRLGTPTYRHDQATLNRVGKFGVEPTPPARRAPQDDGVFGLGGVRVTARGPTRMTVKLAPGSLRGRARYTLLFDLPELASFTLELGAAKLAVSDAENAIRVPNSPILRVELEGDPADQLALTTTLGRPRFYGVIVEGSEPGVVLDTAGIDGARVATALAWAAEPFAAEVAARRPDLVVLSYGTNEAFDATNVAVYARELAELVARLRRGAPALECLIVAPPDALDPAGGPAPRIAEIARVYARSAVELGCAFVSAQALMGGPGSFGAWLHAEPQLARPDRIHFTPRGYRRLGELVALSVFGGPGAAESPAARFRNAE